MDKTHTELVELKMEVLETLVKHTRFLFESKDYNDNLIDTVNKVIGLTGGDYGGLGDRG
jgi:hypothetical protein